jgi:hypothetical protein
VRDTTKYLAILGAGIAILAVGCSEPTSPRPMPASDAVVCSGGGTANWDLCVAPAPSATDTLKSPLLPQVPPPPPAPTQ